MKNKNKKIGFIGVLVLLTLVFLGQAHAAPGLLYPDGVEPGDPSVCEATGDNRCWYVDSGVTETGNGTYEHPFNSFEYVCGYMGAGAVYVPGHIMGGDYLYVKGTFRGSQNVEGVHNTIIWLISAAPAQGGTREKPTVIKSWKGTPRAVFDGEFQNSWNGMIVVQGRFSNSFGAIRIQNIEVKHAITRGIAIGNLDEWVSYADLAGIYAHDNQADAINGAGGAVMLFMDRSNPDITVRQCLFHGNYQNRIGGDGNMGGLSIYSELRANNDQSGAVLNIHDNVFYDEVYAIRHKHSGPITMNVYDNDISNCSAAAFLIRSYLDNEIYNNVIHDVNTAFTVSKENGRGNYNVHIYHNTVYRADRIFQQTDKADYTSGVTIYDNIFNPLIKTSQNGGAAYLLSESSTEVFDMRYYNAGYNLYQMAAPNPSNFLVNGGMYDFDSGKAQMHDSTSFRDDPKFVDADGGDFRLYSDSPAIGAGSSGTTIGAEGRVVNIYTVPPHPSVPANLHSTQVSRTQVDLAWDASTGGTGTIRYRIYRFIGHGSLLDGRLIGTSGTRTYSDTTVSADTDYSYTVGAYDTADNTSAQSSEVKVTTPGSDGGGNAGGGGGGGCFIAATGQGSTLGLVFLPLFFLVIALVGWRGGKPRA